MDISIAMSEKVEQEPLFRSAVSEMLKLLSLGLANVSIPSRMWHNALQAFVDAELLEVQSDSSQDKEDKELFEQYVSDEYLEDMWCGKD